MTKEEALMYFEVSEDFQQMELLDIMDEKLFHLKNEVLQKLSVPSLLEKRRRECLRMLDALEALQMKEDLAPPVFQLIALPNEVISFLELYESQLASAKLIVFHSKTPQELIAAIDFLIDIQEQFIQSFLEVFRDFGPFQEDNSISAQATFESGELLRLLKTVGAKDDRVNSIIQKEASRILKLNGLK